MISTWRENLPSVCGAYEFDIDLAPYTTLKIGGVADVLFTPSDIEDLSTFLQNKATDVPLTLLGEGSNVLIGDGGIRGVVVHIDKGMDTVEVRKNNTIYAEAGARSGKVARAAREASLTGGEFLCGIPGAVGGALKMNAGAYTHETVDILEKVMVLDPQGELHERSPEEIGFSYRHSGLAKGWIYVAALFKLEVGDKSEIRERMRQINKDRSTSQPLNMPSSGSWFKNVTLKDGSKKNSWRVVDEAGCRGWKVGHAQVSEKHSNFFVNLGGATAADMDALSVKVEAEIYSKFGVKMVREVKQIGEWE